MAFTTNDMVAVPGAIPLGHPFAAARLGADDLHAVPGLDDFIGAIAQFDVVTAGDIEQPTQTATCQWCVPFQWLQGLQLCQ
ncbi:hypothetical protein D3C76_1334520 [compost metagenome]